MGGTWVNYIARSCTLSTERYSDIITLCISSYLLPFLFLFFSSKFLFKFLKLKRAIFVVQCN